MELERVEDVPNDRIYLAFRLPTDTTVDFHASAFALDIIGGLASSRLMRRLVRTDESANHVNGWTMGLVGGVSLGLITVDVADGADPVAVEAAVCEELDRFIAEGPDAEEMECVVADTERSWLSSLASIEERADHLSHFALLYDDPDFINTFVDTVRTITPEQVRAAAAEYLRPQSRAVVRYRASDEGEQAA